MIPRSIRGRLTWGLAGTSLVALVVSGWLIYRGTERNTLEEIDRALIEHVELMARQVEFEHGEIVLEHGDRFKTEDGGIDHGAFRIWTAAGDEIARYPEFDDTAFPRFTTGSSGDRFVFRSLELPDGGTMRAISLSAVPTYKEPKGEPVPPNFGEHVHIAVAHNISQILASLASLKRLLVAIGLITFALLVLAVHFLIRSALRPISQVRNELSSREGTGLVFAIDGGDALPTELSPLVESFNSLLARIRSASERERQFTSSAAHELRTPLAALTSILEQSLRRERSPEEATLSIEKSLATTRDMNQLVERLLELSRFDRAEPRLEISDVPLEILIEGAVEGYEEAAAERGLKLAFELADGVTAATDPALLQVVLNNLLENAISYADEGSTIRIAMTNGGSKVQINVENQCSSCDSATAARVFEPFWRADQVRSRAGLHAGLGLSICKKMVDIVGGIIIAKADDGGAFCVTVELPASV